MFGVSPTSSLTTGASTLTTYLAWTMLRLSELPTFLLTGWRVLEIVELCELPRLPSELLRMREAGYVERTCLGFDRACLSYVQRYRRMREKTKQVPVPLEERMKSKKNRQTKTVPFYDEEQLLAFLG